MGLALVLPKRRFRVIKLVITDLDDTLYPWLSFFVPAFYAMAEEVAAIVGEDLKTVLAEYKEIHQRIGTVEAPFTTLLLPSVKRAFPNLSEEQQIERLDPAFHRFNHERKYRLRLFPGVRKMLEDLRSSGITIVGYTESITENVAFRLGQLEIDSFFSRIYVSDSQNRKNDDSKIYKKTTIVHGKKPNSNVLKQIIANENCTIDEAVYLGDSLTKDIYMAKQLGITAILFCDPEPLDAELYRKLVAISSWSTTDFENESRIRNECIQRAICPDYTITNALELMKIINLINGRDINGN